MRHNDAVYPLDLRLFDKIMKRDTDYYTYKRECQLYVDLKKGYLDFSLLFTNLGLISRKLETLVLVRDRN